MILVCGEALIDLVPTTCGDEPGWVPRPGGSPLNVAVGLTRLGHGAGLLCRLSTDAFGQRLAAHLEREGVDLRFAPRGPEPTALALIAVDRTGRPEYRFLWDGTADRLLAEADLPDLTEVSALHVGSVSLVLEPAATTYRNLARDHGAGRLVTLDPNVRPQFVDDLSGYRSHLYDVMRHVDIVKVSDEDLATLAPDADVLATARDWMTRGPALVVVTRGADPVLALRRDGTVMERSVPGVDVIDTVGAGDAFMSGLLAGLVEREIHSGDDVESLDEDGLAGCLDLALRCAALACTTHGADPPRRTDLGR